MAHTPDIPERYVCLNCQVISAGTVVHEDDGIHYQAPDECGACGHTEFAELEGYAHHHRHEE